MEEQTIDIHARQAHLVMEKNVKANENNIPSTVNSAGSVCGVRHRSSDNAMKNVDYSAASFKPEGETDVFTDKCWLYTCKAHASKLKTNTNVIHNEAAVADRSQMVATSGYGRRTSGDGRSRNETGRATSYDGQGCIDDGLYTAKRSAVLEGKKCQQRNMPSGCSHLSQELGLVVGTAATQAQGREHCR